MNFKKVLRKIFGHPVTLILVALACQIALAHWGAHDKKHPMGDVIYAYRPWVSRILDDSKWLGLNHIWVYPFPALAPMVLAKIIAPHQYLTGWLIIAIGLNELALFWLVVRSKASVLLGWFWLAATVALGPVALSRLDGLSVAVGLFAIGSLFRHNIKVATVWLTLATWIKVWPAAILVALLAPSENRRKVLVTGAAVSLGILFVGFLLGGNLNMFGFIVAQDNRGIQIESILAMPWMWAAHRHHGGRIYYDTHILTFQVKGPGWLEASHAMGWYMLAAVAVTLTLVLAASWRHSDSSELVSFASLLLVLELIIFNKVGSPQYLGWLILPVLIGLEFKVKRWWPAVTGVLLATALTQIIYPTIYQSLLKAEFWPLVVLSARNAIEVAIFLWALYRFLRLTFKKKSQQF